MPSILTYICEECNEEFEWRHHAPHYDKEAIALESLEEPPACHSCGNKEVARKDELQVGTNFCFKENNKPGESARPVQFWNNAEENRIKNLKAREAEEKEKAFYGEAKNGSDVQTEGYKARAREKEKALKEIEKTTQRKIETNK